MRVPLWFGKPAHSSALLTELAIPPAARSAHRTRLILCLASALVFACTAVLARAQDYTSIVVFGDSLSDTGNVAHLSLMKYHVPIPGPAADYTLGRFTDGADTLPAAHNYFGVWIEQLAAMFPARPPVVDSLDGGTNYAYGFATTGRGTSVLTFTGTTLSVNVDNIGRQISDYLSTHPRITDRTLFVVWGGAIDVLDATSPDQVFNAAIQQVLNVQRLIHAGATRILVANLPPLGLTPRLNGTPSQAAIGTQGAGLFNDVLAFGLSILRNFSFGRRHPHIFQLDTFSLLNQVVAAPADFSLTNVTGMSRGNFTVNPDSWLFWDDLHPTTRGHNILAVTADRLLLEDEAEQH